MRAVVRIALLLCLGVAGRAEAQTTVVDPNQIDLVLADGATTTLQVSWTFHPLCVRPFEVDVIASDPSGQLENLSGIIQNGCGGDTSVFDIRFTGAAAPQAYDLQFVDSEFGGTLGTIPVTVTPEGGVPLEKVESAGESGQVLSCPYECKPGTRPGTWGGVTTLMLANPGMSLITGGVAFLDGNGRIVAQSRLVLGPQDLDEMYVCRTLLRSQVMPPKAGLVQIYLNRDASGAYGWVKSLVGKFFMGVDEPFDGRVTGTGKTQCRVVPPSVTTPAQIVEKIVEQNPRAVELLLIEETEDP